MAAKTITQYQTTNPLGNAQVGDYFVGNRVPGNTGGLVYAPKVNMDPSPQLAGNLDLNGKNLNATTPTKLSYINNVTSDIQAQLNALTPIDYYNVKKYGVIGDGVTDDTAAIQALLTTVGASTKGGVIYFPSGTYLISSALAIPATGVGAVSIRGNGIGNTIIKRKSTYTSGDLLYITTSIVLSPLNYFSVQDITFQNTGATVTSGAAIHITARPYVALSAVEILDGYDCCLIDGNSTNVWIDKSIFMQTQLVAMNSGLTCTGGHQTNIIITNSLFSGQSAYLDTSMMTYGVYVGCSDGFQILNCFMSAKQGIRIDGGGGQSTLDVRVNNCIFDSCSVLGVNITGTASGGKLFTDISILDSHISPLYSTGFVTVGLQLTGNCDHITIANNTIGGTGGPGVILNQPATSYLGIAPRSIKIHNNDIYNVDLDASASGSAAIQLAANQHGVHLVGNFSGNMIDTGNIAPAGISLAGPNNDIVMVGNNFKKSATPVGYGLTVNSTNYPNLTVYGNCGADDYMNTIKAGVWNGTQVGVTYGGTGLTALPLVPAASIYSTWDANKNFSANSLIPALFSSPLVAGTTTLTVASAQFQQFTGSTTQTVKMPVASTMALGQTFIIENNSTGVLTVQTSSAAAIATINPSIRMVITCILASGTTSASWSWGSIPIGSDIVGSGAIVATASPNIATPAITGFTNASNAAAGVVGETMFVSVTSSAQTSTTLTNNAVMNITAGDWVIWGGIYIATATSVTLCIGNIYTVSATIPVPSTAATQCFSLAPGTGSQGTLTIPVANIKLSSTTPYYLNTAITFTGAITSFWGFIAARRVR